MGGCASKPRDLDGLSTEAPPAESTAATTTEVTTPNATTESAAATTTEGTTPDAATEVEIEREEKKPLVDEPKPEVSPASGEAVPKKSEISEGEKGDVPSTVEAPKGDKVTEETAPTKMDDKVTEGSAAAKMENKVTEDSATTKTAVASPATKAEEQPSS